MPLWLELNESLREAGLLRANGQLHDVRGGDDRAGARRRDRRSPTGRSRDQGGLGRLLPARVRATSTRRSSSAARMPLARYGTVEVRPIMLEAGVAARLMDDPVSARVPRRVGRPSLATLIRHVGDFQLAEDAVQDAFAAAVAPGGATASRRNPGAWLTVGGPAAGDRPAAPRRSVADRAERLAELVRLDARRSPRWTTVSALDDDRLRLIFTCCHPALDAAGAGGAHAAHARRPDDRRDRPRLPRRRADDGQADRARQAQDRRRRASPTACPPTRSCPSACAACCASST